jgi:hypothetical protein
MSNTLITFLVITGTIVPMIFGAIHGNNEVLKKYNCNFKGAFLIFPIIKHSVIHFILFAIIVGVLSIFLSKPWLYGAFCLYAVINYFFMKDRIIENYDIWLKPGEGLLTPEGSKRLGDESSASKNKGNSLKTDDSSTLIYSSLYGGRVIGRVDLDGSVYDSQWGGSYIGHYENEYVYRGAFRDNVLTRYDENGKIYEGMNSFEKLGEVTSDGIIYENGLFGRGNPIAKVEGSNNLAAGAVYFALFR